MDRVRLIAAYRVAFGILTLLAIAAQLADLAGRGALDPVNYFSYFTIESNLIATVLMLVAAARWRAGRPPTLDFLRGGAVVYMTVTGVVFTLLLSGTNVDTAIPWVNAVVHQVMPVVVVLDWLIDPPAARLTIRGSLAWLGYPLGWLGYTLVRGAIVGWYPYPFVNPANGGYGSVAAYAVAIFAGGALLCALVVGVGNLVGPGRRLPTAA